MTLTVEKEVSFDSNKLIDKVHKYFNNYESKDTIMEYLETEEGSEWLENTLKELINDKSIEITFNAYSDTLDFLNENI